ncbi:MAG TPA: insulinase family protein, partial [Candidatus Baltobacteraceae bacterium]|nr:insulinase family protein [Candidatus Baltobacteraceae bacterium]
MNWKQFRAGSGATSKPTSSLKARSARLLAALAAVAIASSGSATRTSAQPAPAESGLTVAQRTLPNGLRVVVLRDLLAPVVTTWLNVEAGSDDEPYTGLAHAQEHMFYRGSTSLSGAQADEIAGFTGDVDDADTQNEITQFYHVVPAQDFELALRMDASRFGELLDAQHDWDQERGAILQEVAADNSDALYRLSVKLQHRLMAGTVYVNEGLGTVESFTRQIQAPQLKAFYHTWYHPNNAIYVIAGDIEPAAAFAAVERFFGAMPAVKVPPHVPGTLRPLAPALYTDTSDQSSTAVIVGYRFPGYASPDYAASVVLGDVLNSARGDLLDLVASGRALAIEADVSPYPQAGNVMILSHVPVTAKPLSAADDIKRAIDGYRTHGVPASLVEAAKQHEVAQLELAADSLQTLASLWSSALAVEHRPPGDDVAAIQRVTAADVTRVLREYLINTTAPVAYAVPKNGAAGGESNGAPAPESAKPEPSHIEPLPAWASAALQRLRVPEKTIDPAAFTLPNGLRVVVQPERASSAVVVAGTVLHSPGLEEPAGQAGAGSVVEALLPFGTTTYSRLAYQAQLDAIAATATAGYTFSL